MGELVGKIEQNLITEPADKDNITTDRESCKPRTLEVPHSGIHTELVRNIRDNGRQEFSSEILLVDTKQVLEEGNHLSMCDRAIVQTEGNLNFTMTETRKEHRSLTFTSSKQPSGESSVHLELLQESAEVITVLHDVQQGNYSK